MGWRTWSAVTLGLALVGAGARAQQPTAGTGETSAAPPAVTQPGGPSQPETPTGPGEGAAGTPPAVTRPGAPEQPEVPPSITPEAPTPLILNKILGLDESPVRVFGWIENSFTGNANGTPRNRSNFSVFPNRLANSWMGNQYYFVVENPTEQSDKVNVGFRFDTLFGNDWQFTKSYGLFDRAFPINHFAGVDLPQIYGELHLPWLTKGGIDIRGGRFYSLTGFESPQAIARPLLSVPYSMNFTPFTFFGVIANAHFNDQLSAFGGTVNGFDRWIDRNYKWGFIGALTWVSKDKKTTLVIGGASVPDQLPRYPPANSPFLPVGVPLIPALAGRRNLIYPSTPRGYLVGVLTHNWTDKLTEAIETDHVFDPRILGLGNDPQQVNGAAYHGLAHWFLYKLSDKSTGVFRSEVFWDPYGMATGVASTYYEMTVGVQWRPRPWLWVRPEARYDWSQFAHPFSDGTRKSQLTLAVDAIVLF
jgi:hypothetical protein